ncbi:metallophosphoesterase [Sphingomonas oleivorans]|uniref:Metallophosphoesterase n=2 Tax=Sphingomonas oleivorans TaxID=1735121 RepID=A0A2T5G380_9SPHN|nr:metallophosphoesterase [Sphingomonas oleivorans]
MYRLLRKVLDRMARPAAVPAGLRIYAIGDIHGRRDLLDSLIAMIDEDDHRRRPAKTMLIFLGDVVDRGPDSRGVIERLITLGDSPQQTLFLMGNHEEMLLLAHDGDPRVASQLDHIGGRQTLASYGVDDREFDRSDPERLVRLLRERIPKQHIDFLRSFRDAIVIGDYLFVHAGIRPGIPLAEQKSSDLHWIRHEFLDHQGDHGAIVIHGHSISDRPEQRPNRIGIDTGAYASGRLTAIGLEGSDRWYLATDEA